MESNFIQTAASAGHAVAYTIAIDFLLILEKKIAQLCLWTKIRAKQ